VCPPFLREASLGLAEEAKPKQDPYYKAKKQREQREALEEQKQNILAAAHGLGVGIDQAQAGLAYGGLGLGHQQFNNIPTYTVSNNTAPSVSYTGSALISNR
jgi:hypothetical protein